MNAILRINKQDNLVTCLRPVKQGEQVKVDGKSIVAAMDIPKFHKMAIEEIAPGGICYKYGQVIGQATVAIHPGDHVHIHNLESNRARGDKQKGEGK